MKQAKATLAGLAQLRCRSALENFGLEQNTFQSLKHLDVNYVKIHGDLVANLATNVEHQEKVKAIADHVSGLGKQTIAAFVEDANSLAVLWQCSVDFIQGYFLQEPGTGEIPARFPGPAPTFRRYAEIRVCCPGRPYSLPEPGSSPRT